MQRRTPWIAVLAAFATLVSCAGSSDKVAQSEAYYSQAKYLQAYEAAKAARHESPDDPRVERQFWKARLAYLLDQGRELTFDERDEVALATFERALALDPDNQIARTWIAKVKQKLAFLAIHRGEEAVKTGDLEEALLSFNEALNWVPRHPAAIEGLQAIEAEWTKRRNKAQDNYLEGVRALAERLFAQTEYYSSIALKNDPALGRAREKKELAQGRLAEERFERAKAAEKDGHFGAALKDYEAVALIQPDLPGLRERLAHVRLEVEVEGMVRRGEYLALQQQFAQSRELLEKALTMSASQRAVISDLLVLAKEREFEHRYTKAKDLELEAEYEAAVQAYRDIEKDWDSYKDVRTRISGLESAIELARKAMAAGDAAEQAGELQKAFDQYSEAMLFWPRNRAIEQKLKELKAKLAPKG